MDKIKCPACGNMISQDSKFCNYCGSKIEHKIVAIHSDESQSEEDKEVEELDEAYIEEQEKAKNMRKWAITGALIVIVLILTSIILYSNGIIGNSGSDEVVDSIASIAEMSGDDALNTLINTLNKENKNGEGAIPAYAAFYNKDGHERIVGFTYLSETSQRSSIKLYTIEYTDSAWRCVGDASRFVDGRITVDRNELQFDESEVPQFIDIDGKQYFYFVYLVSPAMSFDNENVNGVNYHLMFNLYNVDSKDIVYLDYTCTVYMKDGLRYFRGSVVNSQQTQEGIFLQGKVDNAKIIYRPSAEELALEGPENADKKWKADNSEISVNSDAQIKFTYYDKPLFTKDDVVADSRVGNDNFVFISSPKGIVYGFNRTTHKYFVLYASAFEETPKIELTADGKVHVTLNEASIIVNPINGKSVPAPQHQETSDSEPETSIEY